MVLFHEIGRSIAYNWGINQPSSLTNVIQAMEEDRGSMCIQAAILITLEKLAESVRSIENEVHRYKDQAKPKDTDRLLADGLLA